jgi:hypothetical protein
MMFFTSNGNDENLPINLNVSNCHKWLYLKCTPKNEGGALKEVFKEFF